MSRPHARPQTWGLRYRVAWQVIGWLGVAAVIALSLRPQPPQLPGVLGWDKAQHTLAYAMLMWWYRQAFRGPVRWALVLVALGIAIEFVQRLTAHRTFDYDDMVADALGVGLGLAAGSTALGRALAWADAQLRRVLEGERRGGGR